MKLPIVDTQLLGEDPTDPAGRSDIVWPYIAKIWFVVFWLFVAVPIPIIELLGSLWWQHNPLLIYSLYLPLLLYIFFASSAAVPALIRQAGIYPDEGTVVHFLSIFSGIALSVVTFGLLCKAILSSTGTGFVPEGTATYWTWFAFGVDNLLEAVLLDAPTIYDIHLSDVRYDPVWARTIVFSFRLVIDVILLRAIFSYARAILD